MKIHPLFSSLPASPTWLPPIEQFHYATSSGLDALEWHKLTAMIPVTHGLWNGVKIHSSFKPFLSNICYGDCSQLTHLGF